MHSDVFSSGSFFGCTYRTIPAKMHGIMQATLLSLLYYHYSFGTLVNLHTLQRIGTLTHSQHSSIVRY